MLDRIAPLLANPLIIGLVCAGLVLWACMSGASLRSATKRICAALGRAREVVEGIEPQRFASNLELLRRELGSGGPLAEVWRDYLDGLIVPDQPGLLVRSTHRPGVWFNLELYRRVGVDLRYHAALPNLLVGTGLLFTFLGLFVALGAAGGIVEADNETRNQQLRVLLDAASFKFVTSIFGLAASIAYALFRKRELSIVEKALDEIAAALDVRAPLATAAGLQNESNALLRRLSTHLETFSNDLAVSIGSALDNALDQRLGDHIGPLRDAIERLAQGIGTRGEDVVRELLERFTQRLESGTGEHMQGVAGSLTELTRVIGDLQSGLADAAGRMAASADAAAARMSDDASASSARLAAQMEAVVETLRGLATESRVAGASALEVVGTRLVEATAALEGTARGIATAMEQAAVATGGALRHGAADASAHVTAALDQMRGELGAGVAEMRKVLAEATAELRDGSKSGAREVQVTLASASAELVGALGTAAELVRAAGQDAGEALLEGGRTAADLLRQPVDALGAKLRSAVDTLDIVVEAVARVERSAAGVAEPLGGASAEFRQAAQSAREATRPLIEVARQFGAAMERLDQATGRLDDIRGRSVALAEQLEASARSFAGVDAGLAKVIAEMQRALQSYTAQVREFVIGTDSNLAKAATQLHQLVSDLGESIADLADRLPPTNGR